MLHNELYCTELAFCSTCRIDVYNVILHAEIDVSGQTPHKLHFEFAFFHMYFWSDCSCSQGLSLMYEIMLCLFSTQFLVFVQLLESVQDPGQPSHLTLY